MKIFPLILTLRNDKIRWKRWELARNAETAWKRWGVDMSVIFHMIVYSCSQCLQGYIHAQPFNALKDMPLKSTDNYISNKTFMHNKMIILRFFVLTNLICVMTRCLFTFFCKDKLMHSLFIISKMSLWISPILTCEENGFELMWFL